MEIFKFFSSKDKKSKNVAKDRLKLVLIHDRNNVSPILMDNIKRDMIEVLAKYMEVDEEGMDLKLSRSKKDIDSAPVSALVVNIPIVKLKENNID